MAQRRCSDRSVLKAVPLFASFPEEQLRMLTTVVDAQERAALDHHHGGRRSRPIPLYIVLSGRLKVMMSDAEGKEVILSDPRRRANSSARWA